MAPALVSAIRRLRPDALVEVAAGFSSTTASRPPLEGARWRVRASGLGASLAACDVAVVNGGVTLYEACALGVPVVSLAVARAQRKTIRACVAKGAALDAGGPFSSRRTPLRIARLVAGLLEQRDVRRSLSSRARRLVDGRGALRVARQVRTMVAGVRASARLTTGSDRG
jgi:hypothetical protein